MRFRHDELQRAYARAAHVDGYDQHGRLRLARAAPCTPHFSRAMNSASTITLPTPPISCRGIGPSVSCTAPLPKSRLCFNSYIIPVKKQLRKPGRGISEPLFNYNLTFASFTFPRSTQTAAIRHFRFSARPRDGFQFRSLLSSGRRYFFGEVIAPPDFTTLARNSPLSLAITVAAFPRPAADLPGPGRRRGHQPFAGKAMKKLYRPAYVRYSFLCSNPNFWQDRA